MQEFALRFLSEIRSIPYLGGKRPDPSGPPMSQAGPAPQLLANRTEAPWRSQTDST